jgi:glycosyltransferase involved in cell wall biosynthesis
VRILFVAHNFVRGNGQGRIQAEIVRHALAEGHSVTLLANRVDREWIDLGATWHRARMVPERPNLVGVRMFASTVDRIVERERDNFDVVVGGGFTLRRRHEVNLCQFVHGAWIKSPVHVAKLCRGPYAWYQWLYSRTNAIWEKQAYAMAGIVVAPSNKIRDELVGIGVPPERIAVVYNGVDLDEFAPGTEPKATQRPALGLPAAALLALFCGDIRTPRKNLDNTLRAVAQVPSLHLAVVGALKDSPFPAMARELGIADRVHFLDFRRDVAALMRASDLFIFPSRYEAGTLVLTEAAASGLPLVTAKTAGGAEVFGPAAAEVIADPDDLPALVAAIRRFSQSPEARAAAD